MHEPGTVEHACNITVPDKAGGSESQGNPWLQSKFEVRLCYIRPCLKKKKKKSNKIKCHSFVENPPKISHQIYGKTQSENTTCYLAYRCTSDSATPVVRVLTTFHNYLYDLDLGTLYLYSLIESSFLSLCSLATYFLQGFTQASLLSTVAPDQPTLIGSSRPALGRQRQWKADF